MPPKNRCSVCGRETSELYTCLRCRRFVCEKCIGEKGFCRDCQSILNAFKRNLEIELDYVRWCMKNIADTVENRNACVRCWCLREFSVSLLKTIKSIGDVASKNGFENIEKEARKLEKALTQVCAVLMLTAKSS